MKNRTALALLLSSVVLVTGAASCGESGAQDEGQKLTEQAYKQQSEAVPYPVDQLKDSLERRNIREKLLRTNKPDTQGYVYLFLTGSDKPIGYYTVRGKVSSNQSQMTATEIIDRGYSTAPVPVPAPGDDGSYGDNEPGIFFFTTEDVLVTTSLDYVWSDEVLPLDVKRLG